MRAQLAWKYGFILWLMAALAAIAAPASAGGPILSEDFEGAFPPAGWTVHDASAAALDCPWRASDDYPLPALVDNSRGAAIDSSHCAPAGTPDGDVDTWLLTPQLDLGGAVGTVLSFDIGYRHFFPSSSATLDISTDGGGSWGTLMTWNSSPPWQTFPPQPVLLDLSAYDGEASVQLRWRYRAGQGWWIFVDNVILGPAGPALMVADTGALDFGSVHTGINHTLELLVANQANPGDADLVLSAIDLLADPEFSLVGGTCQAGSTVLPPGASCLLRVGFAASAVATFSGQLALASADGQALAIDLSGTGIATSLIDVQPDQIAVSLPIGGHSQSSIQIANLGTDSLQWHIPAVHPGAGQPGGDRLRQGLILIHNSGHNSLVALDPDTGDVVDADFIDFSSLGTGARRQALMHPDGERVLVGHQSNNVVDAFDTEGAYLGVFAPATGADPAVMQNVRGMAFHPDTGHLLVTSAFGDNGNAVLEFDLDGNYLGQFIASGAGGLNGPWSLFLREHDLLLAAGNTVHAFDYDGNPLGPFIDVTLNFVQQVIETSDGHVLVTNSSQGLWVFDAEGNHVGNLAQNRSLNGVHELPNGDLLIAANTGIHQIDRQDNLVRDVIPGASNMFSRVQALDCSLPDWLQVSGLSGEIPVGAPATGLELVVDASGLTPGRHQAVVCIDSNDPGTPRFQVPVSLDVAVPGDYAVIEGVISGSGHCAAAPVLLEGALVSAIGPGGPLASASSGEGGGYALYLPPDSGPVDLQVTAPGHLPASVSGLTPAPGQVIGQDLTLDLDAPCLALAPASLHFDLVRGIDGSAQLTVDNSAGAADLAWQLAEGPGLVTGQDPRAHFPAQPRSIQHRDPPRVSTGADPRTASVTPLTAGTGSRALLADHQVPAYTTTSGTGDVPGYIGLDALDPSRFTLVSASQPGNFFAGTFIGNDFNHQYLLASAGGGHPLHTFGRIDTVSGEFTVLGSVTGAAAVSGWNSLAWDHADGTLYAVGNLDELYTIDPLTLEATLVGRIAGPGVSPGVAVIAIAISPDGLMYALDIADDVLLAVDKTTADAVLIGPTGFDANFAQDMDFDQTTGILYWAAYNASTSRVHQVDLETGLAVAIGDVQGRAELLSFSIARPGGGCSTPADVSWLSVSPDSGLVPAQGSGQADVQVATAGLGHGLHEAFLCLDSNDPVRSSTWIPVTVQVTDADAGFLAGTVASAGHCRAQAEPLAGALLTIDGTQGSVQLTTDGNGQYHLPVNIADNPLTITVSAPGHLDTWLDGLQVSAGQTLQQDFQLQPAQPCITVAPQSLTALAAPGEQAGKTLAIGNVDGHDSLQWSLATAGTAAERGQAMIRMSQNQSDHIEPEFSVGCPNGPSGFLRRFHFPEHPGVGGTISSIDVGIADVGSVSVLNVRLYALPADTPANTIPYHALELVGAMAAPVSPADNGSLLNVPVQGTIDDIDSYDLVVEVAAGGLFFPGANNAGQSHPPFMHAPGCNMPEPSRMDQQENMEQFHVVLMANAVSGGACAPPEQIDWLQLTPSAGTTAAGDSSQVAVEFDAAGLSEGSYSAVVCVDSNDPVDGRIELPVNFTVAAGGSGGELDLALTLAPYQGDPQHCGSATSLEVNVGDQVALCYTVHNNSSQALEYHWLEDSELGQLLEQVPLTLAPGASHRHVHVVTASQDAEHVGTWTALAQLPGYVFDDQAPFQPIDISVTGQNLGIADDGEANVTLPFPVSLYGVSSELIRVANNGGVLLAAETGDLSFYNDPLPYNLPSLAPAFLPLWDDLDGRYGDIRYQVLGTAPQRTAVIQWQRPHFNGFDFPKQAVFQLLLGEDGSIMFNYPDPGFDNPAWDLGGSATIGVQGPGGANALFSQYSFNTPVLSPGQAIAVQETANSGYSTVSNVATIHAGLPVVSVDPGTISASADAGTQVQQELVIANLGNRDLVWTLDQAPAAADPRRHFPPLPWPADALPVRPQAVPASVATEPVNWHRLQQRADRGDLQAVAARSALADAWLGAATVPAFSAASSGRTDYVGLDARQPGALNSIADPAPATVFAQTFIDDDFSRHWFLASDGGPVPANTFGHVDTATGVVEQLGLVTGAPAGVTWTSATWDRISGQVYASAHGGGIGNQLWRIDPDTGAASLVGQLSGGGLPSAAVVIAIAMAPEGLLYGIDIHADVLFAIDRETAAVSVIGPLGINANYAQDMAFDPVTGILYWAAYAGGGASQMASVDLVTGAATPIGAIAGGAQLVSFSVAVAGGDCATPGDVAWLSVNTAGGILPGGDQAPVAVILDAGALVDGVYRANLCLHSNDPVRPRLEVPVELVVGKPVAEPADLGLSLFGVPDVVDAGGSLSLVAAVANFGPSHAAEVLVELALPAAFDFIDGQRIEGAGEWSCTAARAADGDQVSCLLLAGTLPPAAIAAALQINVQVAADAGPGSVVSSGLASSANHDPQPTNNAAATITVISDGLPDCLFADGFQAGGDGSCNPASDPDIYHSPLLNRSITPSLDGISVNWISGEIVEGYGPQYHFNPYHNNLQLSFWWQERDDIAGVAASASGTEFLVLAPGDTVGPDSVFSTLSNPGPAAWANGADGYLGFRFGCAELDVPPPSVCYGYVRLQTHSGDGFPALLVDYAYNRRGQAITIP